MKNFAYNIFYSILFNRKDNLLMSDFAPKQTPNKSDNNRKPSPFISAPDAMPQAMPDMVSTIMALQGTVGNRAIQRTFLGKLTAKLINKPLIGKVLGKVMGGKKSTDLPGSEQDEEQAQDGGVGLPEVEEDTPPAQAIAPSTHQPLQEGQAVDLPGEDTEESNSAQDAPANARPRGKTVSYNKPLKQKDLLPEYAEQERDQPHEPGVGPKQTWNRKAPDAPVKYMQSEEEQETYKLLFEAAQQLFIWQEQIVDTSQMVPAFGVEIAKSKGRAIFAMTAAGKIYIADEGKEVKSIPDISGNPALKKYLSLFNHSSLVAGSPVTAAGEMFFKEGKLVRITDFSGHYQPGIEHTMQVLEVLHTNGLQGMENIEVEFFGTEQTYTADYLLKLKQEQGANWNELRNTLEMMVFQKLSKINHLEEAHLRIKMVYASLKPEQKKLVLEEYMIKNDQDKMRQLVGELGEDYEAVRERRRQERQREWEAEQEQQRRNASPSQASSPAPSTSTSTPTPSTSNSGSEPTREIKPGYQN